MAKASRDPAEVAVLAEIAESAKGAVQEQLRLVGTILRRNDLFVPMFGIWVATFGGALHDPVTTYFMLELGVSTEDLGNFGVIRTIGALSLSPLYGWLLDTRSAYLPAVCSAFACSFGCLFRGFAPVSDTMSMYFATVILGLGAENFWSVVGSYVAMATPRDQRPVVVSGFQIQVRTLKLIGTSLFPALDHLLIVAGLAEKLPRYRFLMSICSVFCVFAFFYILARFTPAERADTAQQAKASQKIGSSVDKLQFGLLMATVVVQSFGETVVTVLWPLHIKHLEWESHEYAYLQLASQVLVIIGTMSYPPMTRLLGQRTTASMLPLVAAITTAGAFLQVDSSVYGQTMHVVNALGFIAVSGVMKVCFQHLITLAVPSEMQGRAFSLVAVLISVGNIFGNLFGTRLIDHETSFARKGATPFLLTSSMFMTIGCLIAAIFVVPCEHRDHHHHPPPGKSVAPENVGVTEEH
eukprot:TRINITY_DN50435_c0_g1_i1.p1 TRINITY_DN50435_c0_g1~~TRINITY_DN50435_c0_g1_i1.p1  ORF type:complete len:467 (+),score=55.20 TRINITY_DN50435_c0_g1_i1:171-1571(+)